MGKVFEGGFTVVRPPTTYHDTGVGVNGFNKNPHSVCLLYTPHNRKVWSDKVWEKAHGVSERCSKLQIFSSAFATTASDF